MEKPTAEFYESGIIDLPELTFRELQTVLVALDCLAQNGFPGGLKQSRCATSLENKIELVLETLKREQAEHVARIQALKEPKEGQEEAAAPRQG